MRGFIFCLSTLIACSATFSNINAQEDSGSLPAELGWVKFRITAGRLQVVNAQYRESKTMEAGNPLVGSSETFRLNVSSQSATVHYRLASPEQTLTVDFDAPNSVIIEWTAGKEPSEEPLATMKYTQGSDGKVQLLVSDGGRIRTHQAESFWHLALVAREDVEQQLLPILTSLRPGWQIEQTAAGVEDALIRLAASDDLPDRARWKQLVGQLGSSSFRERRSAQRQLREAGPAVVAYLNSLPADSLDPERRARVERLIESLSTSADDTPDRIAMWLIDDPLAWVSVLESDDMGHRQTAKKQIEKLLDREIEFDSDADEGVRNRQIEKLRSEL